MIEAAVSAVVARWNALGLPLSSSAADKFLFSFGNALGDIPGTVTGEIFGLTNNATSAATNVVIRSYPTELQGLPAAPFSIPRHFAIRANQFTVSNDVITNATYLAEIACPSALAIFSLNFTGLNTLRYNNNTIVNNGLAGVTYMLAAAPRPIRRSGLLSYLALRLFGLDALGWNGMGRTK
jgi:hypothetical protein